MTFQEKYNFFKWRMTISEEPSTLKFDFQSDLYSFFYEIILNLK